MDAVRCASRAKRVSEQAPLALRRYALLRLAAAAPNMPRPGSASVVGAGASRLAISRKTASGTELPPVSWATMGQGCRLPGPRDQRSGAFSHWQINHRTFKGHCAQSARKSVFERSQQSPGVLQLLCTNAVLFVDDRHLRRVDACGYGEA